MAVEDVKNTAYAAARDTFVNQATNIQGTIDKVKIGPLAALERASDPDLVKFPNDIESIDNYIQFRVLENFVFDSTFTGRSADQGETKTDIILPLPNSIATNYSQNYKTDDMGVLGAAAAVGLDDVIDAVKTSDSVSDLASKVGSAIEKAGGKVGTAGIASLSAEILTTELASLVGAGTLGPAGAIAGEGVRQVSQAAFAVKGIARNPHQAIFYESPNFRKFNFTFELKPKELQDSVNLFSIIEAFKYYSAPQYSKSKHFFQYPNQFQIKTKHDKMLFKYGTSVLTDMSVEYHGEGTPLYYDATDMNSAQRTAMGVRNVQLGGVMDAQSTMKFDRPTIKAPAAVTLSLQFTETRIVTKSSILAGQ